MDRHIAVLEQEVELAEDLGDVAAVDLVDDQDVRLVRGRPARLGDELAGRRARARNASPALGLIRPVALEEVLVGVGGVELDQAELAATADQMLAKCWAMKVLPVPGGP